MSGLIDITMYVKKISRYILNSILNCITLCAESIVYPYWMQLNVSVYVLYTDSDGNLHRAMRIN